MIVAANFKDSIAALLALEESPSPTMIPTKAVVATAKPIPGKNDRDSTFKAILWAAKAFSLIESTTPAYMNPPSEKASLSMTVGIPMVSILLIIDKSILGNLKGRWKGLFLSNIIINNKRTPTAREIEVAIAAPLTSNLGKPQAPKIST